MAVFFTEINETNYVNHFFSYLGLVALHSLEERVGRLSEDSHREQEEHLVGTGPARLLEDLGHLVQGGLEVGRLGRALDLFGICRHSFHE